MQLEEREEITVPEIIKVVEQSQFKQTGQKKKIQDQHKSKDEYIRDHKKGNINKRRDYISGNYTSCRAKPVDNGYLEMVANA